uniref:TET-Associated Glycosyltransferase domain-containing protein n=1 Tax=viral metagenome TaxID=1070528 RepID=A0A6C0LKJ8_9ZZZZ
MTQGNYIVAIPTYNRVKELVNKSLKTLNRGKVNSNKIYIFVANKEQEQLYKDAVPKSMYHKIVVGKVGIANQRKFISKYFPEKQYIVSMDDDVEELEMMTAPDKLVKITNLDKFFNDAYKKLKEENLYIWGIYPVHNPFFMKKNVSTGLKFIIGVLYGYINRHNTKLEPSINAETKEDFEQSILYYKMDGGVVRYNYIVPKTKFNAPGGLGTDRFERNKKAAAYLKKTYPDIITIFQRKNGTHEVKMARLPRNEDSNNKTSNPSNKTNKTKKVSKQTRKQTRKNTK